MFFKVEIIFSMRSIRLSMVVALNAIVFIMVFDDSEVSTRECLPRKKGLDCHRNIAEVYSNYSLVLCG